VEASAIQVPAVLGRISTAGPLLRVRSDDQLVALFRMGYDDAFRTIHDRYRQRLLAYIRQMLAGSRGDAEDVLQDVLLRAYRALRQDDRPVTLRAWLYRVAHNRCVDQLRRPVPPAAEVFELSRTPQQDPSAATERREDLRRLVEDVRRLPEQQRSALLMRELEGLSYVELADALDVTVPAIKSLLVRARVGLVAATEARDAACAEIRVEMAGALDRGVRASGRSRRHLRDCAGCREYRRTLRTVRGGLNALSPGSGPLTTLAKLLGLGGAGSGAGAAAGAGAGGSAAVAGGGAAAATATKVVAVVCCAAVVGGGAAEVKQQIAPRPPRATAARAAPAPRVARPAIVAPAASLASARPTGGSRSAAPADAPADLPAAAPAGDPAAVDPSVPVPPTQEAQTGGALAPEEPGAAPSDSTATTAAPADGTAASAPGAAPAQAHVEAQAASASTTSTAPDAQAAGASAAAPASP
jgi:RNA polymerase sigma factor (sigma-70 family)